MGLYEQNPELDKKKAGTQHPSRKLLSRKDRPFRVLQEKNHMVSVDVNGIHNVVSMERIMVAKTAENAMQATEVAHHDDIRLGAGRTGDGYVVECTVRRKDDQEGAQYLCDGTTANQLMKHRNQLIIFFNNLFDDIENANDM